MKRTIGNWIALLAFTAAAVYLTWRVISPFFNVLIWAGVMAVVSFPVYRRWRRRNWRPSLAALFTTLFVVLVIVVPLALVGMMLARQVPSAVSQAQDAIPHLLNPESRAYQAFSRYIDMEPEQIHQWMIDKGRQIGTDVAAQTLNIVGGLLGAVVQMFFVLFALYYLLKDSDRIVPAMRDALPLERAQADAVFLKSREIISASLNGVLVIAAIQGALGGIAFWVLGLPSPLLWGVVMFLLSMIPMIGPAIVWAPAAIYLAVNGHWIKAVVLTAFGAGVIGMIDNVLRPRLVGERTRLHELIVFFSVLGGLQVFGVLGLVVGPVVVAVTISLVEVFRQIGQPSSDSAAGNMPVTGAVSPPVA